MDSARLLEHRDYLIVEDADLAPGDLVEDLRTFSLREMTASGLTRAIGLTGNHAYVLWLGSSEEPQLGGQRIW